MSKFDPLRFIADHAGMSLVDAISEAYRQGQQDAQKEKTMNHNYVHCRNFSNDCPYECFRAKLVRDLPRSERENVVWASFQWSGECLRKGEKNE